MTHHENRVPSHAGIRSPSIGWDLTHKELDYSTKQPVMIDERMGWKQLLEANEIQVLKAVGNISRPTRYPSQFAAEAALLRRSIKLKFPKELGSGAVQYSACKIWDERLKECLATRWSIPASEALLGADVKLDFPLEQTIAIAKELALVPQSASYPTLKDLALAVSNTLKLHNGVEFQNIQNFLKLRELVLRDLEKEGMSQWTP